MAKLTTQSTDTLTSQARVRQRWGRIWSESRRRCSNACFNGGACNTRRNGSVKNAEATTKSSTVIMKRTQQQPSSSKWNKQLDTHIISTTTLHAKATKKCKETGCRQAGYEKNMRKINKVQRTHIYMHMQPGAITVDFVQLYIYKHI